MSKFQKYGPSLKSAQVRRTYFFDPSCYLTPCESWSEVNHTDIIRTWITSEFHESETPIISDIFDINKQESLARELQNPDVSDGMAAEPPADDDDDDVIMTQVNYTVPPPHIKTEMKMKCIDLGEVIISSTELLSNLFYYGTDALMQKAEK